MRNYKMIISALMTAAVAAAVGTCAFAGTLIQNNGAMYSISLKKEADFSDGQYTGFDNGIGSIGIDTVDEAHGNSVVLGGDASFDITKEGAWLQVNGDTTQAVSAYEFDIYIEKMESGSLKFFQKGGTDNKGPAAYLTRISKDGIGNDDTTVPFKFGEWHTVRFIYDCTGHTYTVYVDDMENAAFGGSINANFTVVQYMRLTLWAADAKVAVDNFKYYSLAKMIDGYETPRLELVSATDKITESEAARIEAKIKTKAELEKVEFYIDGKLTYTAVKAPYIMEHLFEKGSYTVRAVAKDIYGESGEATLAVTALADTKPRIVLGLADGESYDKTELRNVSVAVSMSDAQLTKGTVSVDGTKTNDITLGDNRVDLSDLSIGRHSITVYAENNLGEATEKTVSITVEKSFDDVVWSMNFNDGSILGTLNGSGQFTRLEALRDDFKDSLLVGANTTQDVSKEGAWIPLELKNTTTTAMVDFDIYFSDINGNGMTAMLVLSSNRPVLFKITDKGIVDSDGQVVGSFAAKRWYHATLTINSQNTSYSLYIDDEAVLKNKPITMQAGAAMPSVRLVSMLQGTDETYFAVDNIVVRQVTTAPSVVNITSEKGGENTVSANDKEIKVYFSGALQPTSVYPSKFSISGAVIEKAEYDAANYCVTLTLEKPLSAGTYRLEVAENLVMGNGEIYAEKLFGAFAVQGTSIEAVYASVSSGMLNAEIANNSQSPKKVYIITNIYSSNVMKSSTAKEFNLSAGSNYIFEPITGYTSGDTAEIFMWDSLNAPTCIMSVKN